MNKYEGMTEYMKHIAQLNIPPVPIIDKRDGWNRRLPFQQPGGDNTKEVTSTPAVISGDQQFQNFLDSLGKSDKGEDAQPDEFATDLSPPLLPCVGFESSKILAPNTPANDSSTERDADGDSDRDAEPFRISCCNSITITTT